MSPCRRLAWAVAALVAATPCAAAPLEAYGRLPSIEIMTLSPDGQTLAYVATDGEQRKNIIQNIQSRAISAQINAGAHKVRALQWAGAHHVIITRSVTGDILDVTAPRNEWFVATDFDLRKKVQRPLISGIGGSLNVVEDAPDIRFIDGAPHAFVRGVSFVAQHGQTTLFKSISTEATPAGSKTKDSNTPATTSSMPGASR